MVLIYRGIRYRIGKWVTQIRVPKKNKRIWLGTYPTPEMAATAYDVGALALKGREALLNFLGSVRFYPIPCFFFLETFPIPCSNSETHIKTAAAAAPADEVKGSEKKEKGVCGVVGYSTTEFVDEKELWNKPNLLVDMARGRGDGGQ